MFAELSMHRCPAAWRLGSWRMPSDTDRPAGTHAPRLAGNRNAHTTRLLVQGSNFDLAPLPGKRAEFPLVPRPIVRSRRIEIRAVRPNQRTDFFIDGNLLEQAGFPQGSVDLARKNRLEVDQLLALIVKTDP
jgi:hypothetical protein